MKNIFYSFFSMFLIFGACSSQEELTKYSDTQIIFGSGGGFSGQEKQYTLSSDGMINLYDNQEHKINVLLCKHYRSFCL